MIDRRLSMNEVAALLSVRKCTATRRARRESWPYRSRAVRGGKERLYRVADLPEDVRIAYARSVDLTPEDLRTEPKPLSKPPKKGLIDAFNGRGAKVPEVRSYDGLTEPRRKVAELRLKVLLAYSESGSNAAAFMAAYAAGRIVPELRERLGPHGDIRGKTSLYRWLERYERHGLAGLAPQYEGKGVAHSLPQEAKDRLEWLFLDSGRPSVKAVWRLLGQYGFDVSETTARRYLDSLPGWLKDRHRMGRDFFKAKYLPHIERDYTKLRPMEMICGDYMTQDFVCRKGDRVLRARLCAFLDMRSRAVVGWNLQETANSVGVIRSLKMAFADHGLPETLYVDNGREFRNFQLCGNSWKARKTRVDPELLDLDVGILAECGVKVVFAQAHNGQAKPIERFWRTMHDQLDRFMPSYTGSNTADRPDETGAFRSSVARMKKEDAELIPSFEEVEEKIGNFVRWYNEKWHHCGRGMDGRAPMDVFAEFAGPRREIPEGIGKYLFAMRYVRVVQRNGVTLDGVTFRHKDMFGHNGEKVEVRRPMDDAGRVHVFSYPDRVYLFDAEVLAWTGDVAEDMARKNKLIREIRELDKKKAAKRAEYDRGAFLTPAETYAAEAVAAEAASEVAEPKAVNGGPLAGNGPALTPARAEPRKKLVSPLDAD